MAVSFYHVLAFGSSAPVSALNQPYYLGKTSDLVFRASPDKTIDCDDGSTDTGSEKLECSFSILGKVINPWPIRRLWLVPVLSDYNNAEIIKLNLDSEDYRMENKSGEFEKLLFSAVLRYGVDANPLPYEYDSEYFADYCLIIGKVQNIGTECVVGVTDEHDDPIVTMDASDNIVSGYYALCLAPKGVVLGITIDGEWVRSIDTDASIGVVRADFVL